MSSKSEIRNPKPERNPKAESVGWWWRRVFSDFGLRVSFGFRASDFGCFHRLSFLAVLFLAALPVRGADLESPFDAANRAYEQGKFTEAAALYEKLIPSAPRNEALYFNSGNAWFKAGQTGRAIAAYRQAEALAPRDPGIRFNLQFARKKVSTSDAPAASLWQRAFTTLTLNEWAGLLAGAVWLWFGLLALREWRPALRTGLSGYTATAGVMCLALAGCLAASALLQC